MTDMDGTIRENIRPGFVVVIVKKEDQRTGRMTQGIVKDILTSAAVHPRGIKVRLVSGEVGRVQHIQTENEETTGVEPGFDFCRSFKIESGRFQAK